MQSCQKVQLNGQATEYGIFHPVPPGHEEHVIGLDPCKRTPIFCRAKIPPMQFVPAHRACTMTSTK